MRYLLEPPHPHSLRRLPPPTHLPIVKKLWVIAQSVSPSSMREQRISSGAVPHVGTICTRTASSNGQGVKQEKRSVVCIGKTLLNTV